MNSRPTVLRTPQNYGPTCQRRRLPAAAAAARPRSRRLLRGIEHACQKEPPRLDQVRVGVVGVRASEREEGLLVGWSCGVD